MNKWPVFIKANTHMLKDWVRVLKVFWFETGRTFTHVSKLDSATRSSYMIFVINKSFKVAIDSLFSPTLRDFANTSNVLRLLLCIC